MSRRIALLIALLAGAQVAPAPWLATGPDGGYPSAIAIAGSTVYVATGDGVYRSADAGLHWLRSGNLPRAHAISDVAVAPSTPTTVLAASSWDFSVYRSTDGGNTWIASSVGIYADLLRHHPLSPTDVVAIGSRSFGQTLRYSDDGGQTWHVASSPDSTMEAVAVDADRSVPRRFYALDFQRRLLRSNDGGANWNLVSTSSDFSAGWASLAIDPYDSNIVVWAQNDLDVAFARRRLLSSASTTTTQTAYSAGRLLADPLTPGRFWWSATNKFPTVGSVLYESLDHAASWSAVSASSVSILSTDAGNLDRLYGSAGYAGPARSNDAGRSWLTINHGIPLAQVTSVSSDPSNPAVLLAATDASGVARSVDAGATWQWSNDGLARSDVLALTRQPGNSQIVYAGTGDGLFRSDDAGLHWQQVAIASFPLGGPRQLRYLAVSRADPARLVGLTRYGRLLWSSDGGVNWIEAGGSGPLGSVRILAASPNGVGKVYALAWQSSISYRLMRAEAHGAPLAPAGGTLAMSALAVHPHNDSELIAMERVTGSPNWPVWRSRDGGESWQARGQITLPSAGYEPQIRFDPCDPRTLYALAGRSFHRSDDAGMSWHEEPLQIASLQFGDLDVRCKAGSSIVVAGTLQAGAQVREPVAMERIFADGFGND